MGAVVTFFWSFLWAPFWLTAFFLIATFDAALMGIVQPGSASSEPKNPSKVLQLRKYWKLILIQKRWNQLAVGCRSDDSLPKPPTL
jgi:hypothetical protein